MAAHHHHHHHETDGHRTDVFVQRRLVVALAPFIVMTLLGLLLLWPSGDGDVDVPTQPSQEHYEATIASVDRDGCETPPGGEQFSGCSLVEIQLEEGPDAGESFSLQFLESSGRPPETGDPVVVARVEGAEGQQYAFVDYRRGFPLILLAIVFVVVVIALSRWHGVTSLIGLGLSLLILVMFVLPAIVQGQSPVLVSVVGAAAVMFVTLYLAHGFNARTSTAILGTLTSLLLTVVLASIFVEVSRFTGFGSEEATFLQVSASQVNLQGLLLGGIIIGTLGVLDDVTVTQASAVWELHNANPDYSRRDLYRAGIRIGRDHIASTVNTLVLAYAGASLPLLILFTLSNRGLGTILNSEVVAEEVVRTLVGSIGLVASVPITTALASAVVASGASGPDARSRRRRRVRKVDDPFDDLSGESLP